MVSSLHPLFPRTLVIAGLVFATASVAVAGGYQEDAAQANQEKSTKQDEEKPNASNVSLEDELKKLITKSQKSFSAIETAHIESQKITTNRGLNKEITIDQCRALILGLDLASNPDKIGLLRNALSETPSAKLKASGWGAPTNFYTDGESVRTSRPGFRPNEVDIHIQSKTKSIRWDSANRQINIMTPQEDVYFQPTLQNFLGSLPPGPPPEGINISQTNDELAFSFGPTSNEYKFVLNRKTGFVTQQFNNSTRRDSFSCWLGWKNFGEVRFPQIAASFHFRDGKLTRYEIERIKSAQFNIDLPETTFVMSAPAGANIFDKSKPHGFAGTLYEDIFDVTSDEQLKLATKFVERELTPSEKRGVAAAKKIYKLKPNQYLKRIGPPFPMQRKYAGLMLKQRPNQGPEIPSFIISSAGPEFDIAYEHSNGSFTVKTLLERFTNIQPTAIIGDEDVLNAEILGDFVYRKGCRATLILKDLKRILKDQFQSEFLLELRNIESTVYVFTGDFKLNVHPLRKRVEVHGGDYKGLKGEIIQSGDLDAFTKSLGEYINTKVVNDANPLDKKPRFKWSTRWYDAGIPANRPKTGFKIETEKVLKIVSQQTGLEFSKESETLTKLVLERIKR